MTNFDAGLTKPCLDIWYIWKALSLKILLKEVNQMKTCIIMF